MTHEDGLLLIRMAAHTMPEDNAQAHCGTLSPSMRLAEKKEDHVMDQPAIGQKSRARRGYFGR